MAPEALQRLFDELGLVVLERGWLSSNNIVFAGRDAGTVVDTGYHSHSEQTVELVRRALHGRPVERILNTHLHSDHCGGNAGLQRTWGCAAWIPEASFDAARNWTEERLSYRATGQRCDRFDATDALPIGDVIRLGPFDWSVIGAPGHDPDALMFFQPQSRVLISADALWERGLAIVFPELEQRPGFPGVEEVLDGIARLDPVVVIPGHGPPFSSVREAIARSRTRLEQFRASPQSHLDYALRALVMFRMLEARSCPHEELVSWMEQTPIFDTIRVAKGQRVSANALADSALDRLVGSGALRFDGPLIHVRAVDQ